MSINLQKDASCIEIEPAEKAERSIIWLHGLGADGSDFVPIVSELKLPAALKIRFIFPNAPVMPVTINGGYAMPAWFDILDLTRSAKIDEAGIAKSIATVQSLIAKEVARGVPTRNIILAGFSQGAVMAITAGITSPEPLAGIIALSGYLPLAEHYIANSSVNCNIPIFIAHGTEDIVVQYAFGDITRLALQAAGYPVTWKTYPIAHSVSADEVEDISAWIQELYGR